MSSKNVNRRAILGAALVSVPALAVPACNPQATCVPEPNAYPEDSDLPAWFEENRVQAQTRLPPQGMVQPPAASNYRGLPRHIANDLGAEVYTRHVKSRDEDPWWPTHVAATRAIRAGAARTNHWTGHDRRTHTTQVPEGTNVLEDINEQSSSLGLTWIAYYTTEFDDRIAHAHPDWVCRQPGGAPNDLAYRGTLGTALDITTPYRHLVADRLAEVIRRGAKGIYVDRALIPPWGDASHWSLQQYYAETGRQRKLDGENGSLQEYSDWYSAKRYSREDVQWFEWKSAKIAETISLWRQTIRRVDPNAVLIVSASNLPALVRPDCSTLWCAQTDSVKSETDSALALSRRNQVLNKNPALPAPPRAAARALGWALTRDSAEGRPFHVWSGTFLDSVHSAQLWAAAVIAHGGIASLDIYEETAALPNARPSRPYTSPRAARAVFEVGRSVAPYMAYTRPLRHAVVHVPEHHRNSLLSGPDGVKAVERDLVLPCIGAFDTFAALGMSSGTIDDRELAQGLPPEAQLLYLPTGDLTAAQAMAVRQFAASGGKVIRQKDVQPWSPDPAGARSQFREAARDAISSAPVRLDSRQRCHASAYRLLSESTNELSRIVVATVNDFSDLGMGDRSGAPTEDGEDSLPQRQRPAPITGATLSWRKGLLPEDVVAYDHAMGVSLDISESDERRSVTLPDFSHLSCVVVARCRHLH